MATRSMRSRWRGASSQPAEPRSGGPAAPPRLARAGPRRAVRGVQPATRSALLLIAVHGRISPDSSLPQASRRDALDAAFAAGVVERAEDQVRFVHPLLAAAVDQAASPGERRAAHGASPRSSATPSIGPVTSHAPRMPRTPSVAETLEQAGHWPGREAGRSRRPSSATRHCASRRPTRSMTGSGGRSPPHRPTWRRVTPARAMIADELLLGEARVGVPRARALVLRADLADLAGRAGGPPRGTPRALGRSGATIRDPRVAWLGLRFLDTRLVGATCSGRPRDRGGAG